MDLPEYRIAQRPQSAWSVTPFDDEELYLLDPPYQRGPVWDDDRKAALIRSLQMRIPTGIIILNDRRTIQTPYAVVDGKQRILALRAWFDGKVTVPARWFRPDEVDGGYPEDPTAAITYDDLTGIGRRHCKSTWLIAVGTVSGLTVPEEAALFGLINFGGVDQTEDDALRAAAVAVGSEF